MSISTMESISADTVIAGHDRYAVRIHFHRSTDYGVAYFDASAIVDTMTDEEHDFTPGVFGISEPVFCVAEESAWESIDNHAEVI